MALFMTHGALDKKSAQAQAEITMHTLQDPGLVALLSALKAQHRDKP